MKKKTYRFTASNADQFQDRISTKHIFDAKDRILVTLGKVRQKKNSNGTKNDSTLHNG